MRQPLFLSRIIVSGTIVFQLNVFRDFYSDFTYTPIWIQIRPIENAILKDDLFAFLSFLSIYRACSCFNLQMHLNYFLSKSPHLYRWSNFAQNRPDFELGHQNDTVIIFSVARRLKGILARRFWTVFVSNACILNRDVLLYALRCFYVFRIALYGKSHIRPFWFVY